MSTNEDIDLIPYLHQYFSENENTIMYIGSDSQNEKIHTSYATVIVLHNSNKGGHVLYTKEKVPKVKDRFSRLWAEVQRSVELSDYLVLNKIRKPGYIDVDLNPNPNYPSNQVLSSAIGYIKSMGYEPRCKPNAIAASYVADLICK
jgi:predicted RNase H-related nuclease YkuK (DUF458 family)